MTVQVLERRFDELLSQLDDVEKTTWIDKAKRVPYVDDQLLLGWRVKARHLLSQTGGAESEHYRQFVQVEQQERSIPLVTTNHTRMQSLKAVFLAAKEDYEGGYMRSTRSLVHAELFADELEQARELLTSGYKAASAVVARVVLETTLRKLCGDRNVSVGKLDKMNADLAKGGLYDTLVQKRVTWLADIGNKAAHGHWERITEDDVKSRIAEVERFVSDHPVA